MSDPKVISATFCASRKGEPLITVGHIAGDDATFTPDELRALGATLIKIADDSAFMTALREERARSALRGDYVVGE